LIERFQRDFDDFWRIPRMHRRSMGMMPFRRGMAMMMPSVDLEDRGKDFRLTVDLPEFKKEDIDIEVMDDAVAISAEKKTTEEEKNKNYIRRERMSQRFYRRVELPEKVDPNQAQANLNNGVLEITLPKKEPKEKKKLPIT
jgi:HSP20 family protein